MNDVSDDIVKLLLRELEGFNRELDLFPDEAGMWKTVPGVTNSAANLALHVAGGLQYFVGAVLGRTGYVRNREAEFNQRSGGRDAIRAELDRAAAIVHAVLPSLSGSVLASPFPEPVLGVPFGTQRFLLHLCAHAAFHLGQAGYVRRAVTGDARSSGPVPLGPLASSG